MIYDNLARVLVQWLDGSLKPEIWNMIRVPAVGESIMMDDGSNQEFRVVSVHIAAFRGSRDSSYASVDATIGVTSK